MDEQSFVGSCVFCKKDEHISQIYMGKPICDVCFKDLIDHSIRKNIDNEFDKLKKPFEELTEGLRAYIEKKVRI